MSAPALIVGLLLALKADPAKTAAEVKRFREAKWTEVRRMADIDPAVMRAFRELLRKSAISDVGGPFDATDISTGKPHRRLVVAGHSEARWFICYEVGGRGHHLTLVVFDRSGDTPRAVLLARGWPGKHDDVRGWKVDAADLRRTLGTPDLEVDRHFDWTYF